MNKAMIIGNLTKEPESRTTQSGISVTTFTVAVQRRFKTDETDFFPVVTWRGLADNCAKYLVKGQKVAVAGQIQTRNYEDKDGQKRYITEIIADDVEFLSKPSGETRQQGERQLGWLGADAVEVDDEDLPF